MRLVLRIFRFPRQELETRWWHRLFKVLIVASTIVLSLFAVRWSNEIFKPYYVYSFDDKFQTYESRVRNWADMDSSNVDLGDLVFKFKYSHDPAALAYVEGLENSGLSNYAIAERMRSDGLLDDLRVRDLQYSFYGDYYKFPFVAVVTLGWYFLATHLFYRVLVYILVGKATTTTRQ